MRTLVAALVFLAGCTSSAPQQADCDGSSGYVCPEGTAAACGRFRVEATTGGSGGRGALEPLPACGVPCLDGSPAVCASVGGAASDQIDRVASECRALTGDTTGSARCHADVDPVTGELGPVSISP